MRSRAGTRPGGEGTHRGVRGWRRERGTQSGLQTGGNKAGAEICQCRIDARLGKSGLPASAFDPGAHGQRSASAAPYPAAPGQSQYAGGAIFDYHVAGSAIEFHRRRYYFVTTYTKDPSRIEAINVGTSPSKYSRVELEAANAALRARFRKDGWLTGHEVYRTEEDRQLHGGKTRGEAGALWLKNGIVLDIETRRLDDPKPGEDPATGGEWIQYVELRTRVDFPLIERYVFAAPEG